MSRGVTYVRMYPTDWRSGCMGLSLEQEGLYVRMCMFVAETGRRVPLDDTEAARMLNVQTRNYRRVLGELLRLGKVIRHDDGYGNTRMEHERQEAEKATHRQPATASDERANRQADQGEIGPDHAAAVAGNADTTAIYSRSNSVITELAGEIHQQNQGAFIEPITKKDDVGFSAGARDWEILNVKLTEAAGPILAEIASHPGLLNLSIPTMWLNSGADLDLDILPTLREIAAKRRAASKVKTWDYFTGAIANAKQRRERGLTPAETTVELLRPVKSTTAFAAAFKRFQEART